jgi:proteasome lid subunit RPN8/RPN11
MKVDISESAIISMIMSAVEVYKKETFGVLLGKKSSKEIKIKHAINFQTAKRDYEYVSIDKARENRINHTLKYMSDLKVMGDFHSHPDFPEKLSRHDEEELKKAGADKISVLVLVKKSKARKNWKYDSRNKRIIGNLAGLYYISITASIYNYKKRKSERVGVKCRHLNEMNRRIKLFSDLMKKLEKLEKLEKQYKRKKKMLKAKKMKL